MQDMQDFDDMRRSLLEASQTIHKLLPQALQAAYDQGRRDAAAQLAEIALSIPDKSSTRASHPKLTTRTSQGHGKVLSRVRDDLRHSGADGREATKYRQSLVDDGLARSSVHMAIKRLVELGEVVQIDGRLFYDDQPSDLSEEGAGRAGQHKSAPSSEHNRSEVKDAAALVE